MYSQQPAWPSLPRPTANRNRVITDEAKGIIQPMDKDKDGKISKAEFVKGSLLKEKKLSEAVFDALDTNGDGSIFVPEYLRVWGGWARRDYKAQEKEIAKRLKKIEQKVD